MRITLRPPPDPQREVDVTQRLVAAIAEELWRLYGGNDELNWIEAEAHLRRVVEGACMTARSKAAAVDAAHSDAARTSPCDIPDADDVWGVGSAIGASSNAA